MQEIESLERYLKGFDWFHSIAKDSSNRYVVYANYIDYDVMTTVPDYCDGVQVLLHFSAYLNAKASNYVRSESKSNNVVSIPFEDIEFNKDIDLDLLELEHLINQVGKNTLLDIFYEIHDGDDAVTFTSEFFPLVRNRLEKLYNTCGFDVLYDILEDESD